MDMRLSWGRSVIRGGLLASLVLASLVLGTPMALLADTDAEKLGVLRTIRPNNESDVKTAASVVKQLSESSDIGLIDVLKSMKGATLLGKNWLLGLANSLHRKSPESANDALRAFLMDASQDPEARYTVFRWLTDNDAELKAKMLDGMLQDSSPELRFEAVAKVLNSSESLETGVLQSLLEASRHPEQIVAIIRRLGKQGVTVNQSKHFGFLDTWKLIGPFDNVGSKSFDKEYAVELDYAAGKSLAGSYDGKSGAVQWVTETTADPEGIVDLAKVFNNEKGCIVYGLATVELPADLDCEIRVGCINAQKVWVNGKLVIANEVYHTGMQIDQYVAPIKLRAGKNQILVKVCQNEQKEAWAQRYVFQARLCDSTGKAISTK